MTDESDRAQQELQTGRNVRGLELEQRGEVDEAIALYEDNLREGFEADWPYGRLVAIYERQGRLDQALRVLDRGIEVFKASKRRTPEDRRAVISVFRNRGREVKRKLRQAEKEAAKAERQARTRHE